MIRHLILLPGGEEIFSGTAGEAAISSVKLTRQVNTQQELTPGAVCAAQAEITLFAPAGLPLQAGEELTLYQVSDGGERTPVGIFLAQKPEQTGGGACRVTAYDRVSLLDRDLTEWLAELTGWPYSVQTLAEMTCQACGLTLEPGELPNGNYLVNAFSAQGITGRQLLAWVGELTGRFCRATAAGTLEFAWYTKKELEIGPSGEQFWFAGSLTQAEYETAPIDKVQLQLTREDVGAVYPDDSGKTNALTVTGNYLLTSGSPEALETVAQGLYEQLQGVSYTPMTLTVPSELGVTAGDILTVAGKTVYVMASVQTGGRTELRCTGSRLRSHSTALNRASYKALTGRVLELQADLQGLQAENRDAAGNLAALRLAVEGLNTEVVRQQQTGDTLQQQLTTLEQTADGVKLQVQKLLSDGTDKITTAMGYTFDDTGLSIRRQGQEISTKIDHTGMQVSRLGENVLQATAEGVKAVDISVKNYLMVGLHARLEDYPGSRTACFWRE